MWWLVGLLVAAGILSLMPAAARRVLGYALILIVGWIVLYVASDLRRSFREIKRSEEASKLIAVTEVKVDDLQLSGSDPATYEMRGLVHNLSPTYSLSLTRFTFVVEDCVTSTNCEEQIRGRAEVGNDVKPNETAMFSTRAIRVEGDRGLLPPHGQRRITSKVSLTSATMPAADRGRD